MPPSNTNAYPGENGPLRSLPPSFIFVAIISIALVAFEIFNFSTTDLALYDLLGDLAFMGIPWSIILAVAFCGIDFAGIARLFTPEQGRDEPNEVWYLFGAWLLAATMNSILTWWGVSIAVAGHYSEGSTVVDPGTLTNVVPVFVAIMVWVIRILIIGTLSLALDRMFHPGVKQTTMLENGFHAAAHRVPEQTAYIPSGLNSTAVPSRPRPSAARPSAVRSVSAAPRGEAPVYEDPDGDFFPDAPARSRMEPSYHSLAAKERPSNGQGGGSRFRKS